MNNAAPSASSVAFEPDNLLPSILQPAILPASAVIVPDILTAEPVSCPLLFNTNPLELISVVEIVNPPMEADLNVANPCESILELALASVDGAPPIEDGVRILLAVISP